MQFKKKNAVWKFMNLYTLVYKYKKYNYPTISPQTAFFKLEFTGYLYYWRDHGQK